MVATQLVIWDMLTRLGGTRIEPARDGDWLLLKDGGRGDSTSWFHLSEDGLRPRGVTYGTFENDARVIGGLHLRLPETGFASTLIHDGKNFHPTLELLTRR